MWTRTAWRRPWPECCQPTFRGRAGPRGFRGTGNAAIRDHVELGLALRVAGREDDVLS
ncbi:hypothetical protein [Streptomyces sp. NPDC048057]|uniref:hypothetical protein n=1 Tax=Streptomyces sp. NPDC048057 TaxID=3155628 RepID=UPI0033D3759C